MPILDVQRRVAVIGHIRIGERVATSDGKERPRALTAFRFTSQRAELIAKVADVFGGTPKPWANPGTGVNEHEVVTTASEIAVLIPPADVAFSQSYELWSGGGCLRRCDGITESKGNEPQPCICRATGERSCESVTRLSLLVPEVAHIFGVWRLTTQSFYASGEMASAVELALELAYRRNEHLASATLRLEQRVARRPGEKPHRYPVPVLDVWLAPEALGVLTAPSVPALPPEPADESTGPVAAALTVAGLPEPAPRIERGAASPPPRPLTDDLGRAPALGLSSPASAESTRGSSAPVPVAVPPSASTGPSADRLPPDAIETAQLRDIAEWNRNNDEHDIATEADIEKQTQKTRRYVIAQMREAWPNMDKAELDDRRACLAIMLYQEPSWQTLQTAQLYKIANYVKDIRNLRLQMEPIVGGFVFTTRSGRKLFIRKDVSGQWEHWTQEKEET